MFYNHGKDFVDITITPADKAVYTNIFYLDVPSPVVYQQRERDKHRIRATVDSSRLEYWQQDEQEHLRDLCLQNGILYARITQCVEKAAALLRDCSEHSEGLNLRRAKTALNAITCHVPKLETVLVLDADKTLAPQDTGALFWNSAPPSDKDLTLKTLFSSNFGYSYEAFRQAMLLYEQSHDDRSFDELCAKVAETVNIYPDILTLLQEASKHDHVMAVVFTSGPKRVWEMVLTKAGLSEKIKSHRRQPCHRWLCRDRSGQSRLGISPEGQQKCSRHRIRRQPARPSHAGRRRRSHSRRG